MQPYSIRLRLIILLLLSIPSLLLAQRNETKVKKDRKVGFIALPLVFRTPETRWAFGAAAQVTWRFRQTYTSRPSFVRPGFVYTQNKQILAYLPYRMFWGKKGWTSFGELGYYKYNFLFYGIGNNQDSDFEERYDYKFPRLRFNLLKVVRGSTYMGATYAFDNVQITETDPNGQLTTGEITGSQGGIISGAGWMTIVDTRNNIFFPSKGEYIESEFFYNSEILGSDFEFFRYTLNGSKYIPINWARYRGGYYYDDERPRHQIGLNHVLALQFYTQSHWGDPPFDQLARLGGANRLRGLYEGRFRDKHLMLFQAEYRAMLIWRLGVSAHAAYGMVAPTFRQYSLSNGRFTWGGGARFTIDKAEKINFRLDYGRGKYGSNFYITVGEAF